MDFAAADRYLALIALHRDHQIAAVLRGLFKRPGIRGHRDIFLIQNRDILYVYVNAVYVHESSSSIFGAIPSGKGPRILNMLLLL